MRMPRLMPPPLPPNLARSGDQEHSQPCQRQTCIEQEQWIRQAVRPAC